MQRCTLEKKTVKKIHPDTACRKIPREVCVPNNCAMVTGEEICRDENRMLVQNVPQEECELQPEENCHMEAVLVPRSVRQSTSLLLFTHGQMSSSRGFHRQIASGGMNT